MSSQTNTAADDLLAQARSAYAAQRFDESEDLLRRVLDTGQHRGEVLFRLGILAYNAGRYDEAVARFTESTQTGELSPEPLFYLGDLAERRGDRDEAVRLYAAALGLDPRHERACERLVALRPGAGS